MNHMSKPIGEINGPWAILFKITQLAVPLLALTIIPWSIWVTSTLYARETRISKLEAFVNVGPRFTANDAETLRLRVLSEVDSRFVSSNQKVADRLDSIMRELVDLKLELTKHMAQSVK